MLRFDGVHGSSIFLESVFQNSGNTDTHRFLSEDNFDQIADLDLIGRFISLDTLRYLSSLISD